MADSGNSAPLDRPVSRFISPPDLHPVGTFVTLKDGTIVVTTESK